MKTNPKYNAYNKIDISSFFHAPRINISAVTIFENDSIDFPISSNAFILLTWNADKKGPPSLFNNKG